MPLHKYQKIELIGKCNFHFNCNWQPGEYVLLLPFSYCSIQKCLAIKTFFFNVFDNVFHFDFSKLFASKKWK